MRVSVVTPVFNGERFIQETIDSIRDQDIADLEYIVVDGGSTDATQAIVERNSDIVTNLVSGPDEGMYDALNKGFSLSTGDLRCYINADDLLSPGALSDAIKVFKATSADLVFANCIFVDEGGGEQFRYRGVGLNKAGVRWLGRVPFAQQTAIWTTQLHQKIGGFDHRYRYCADTKFFFDALLRQDASAVHMPMYSAKFRQHAAAFSSKVAKQMVEEHRAVMSEFGMRSTPMRWLVESYVKLRNVDNIIKRSVEA